MPIKENEHATLGRATIDTKTIPNPGPHPEFTSKTPIPFRSSKSEKTPIRSSIIPAVASWLRSRLCSQIPSEWLALGRIGNSLPSVGAANVMVDRPTATNMKTPRRPVSQSAASSLFQLTLVVVAKLVAAKLEIIVKRRVFKRPDCIV